MTRLGISMYITLTLRHFPKIFSLRQGSHLNVRSEIRRSMFKIALSGTSILGSRKKNKQHQQEKLRKTKKNFYSFRQGKITLSPWKSMKYVYKWLLYKYCYEMGEITSNRRQSNPFFYGSVACSWDQPEKISRMIHYLAATRLPRILSSRKEFYLCPFFSESKV